jgi:predicted nucleic acid-binding protein
MKYLLDVNALIALCIAQHQFHSRVALWTNSQRGAKFLTSSITEIGFVRIAAQLPNYTLDVVHAKAILASVKSSMPLGHIADANDILALPGWVDRPGQVTDGHLLQLAVSHGAVLATLDQGIPGAYLLP